MNLTIEQKRDIYNNLGDYSGCMGGDIDVFMDVVEKDLLSAFDDIDKKANIRVRKYVETNSYSDDDISEDNFEDALHTQMALEEDAIDMEYDYAYNIYPKMEQDFLNMIVVWLYHIYEKDCKKIFNYRDKEKTKTLTITGSKLKILSEYIGINMKPNSNWFKINTELRLLNNSIKHGDIKPELKNLRLNLIIKEEIRMTFEEITKYAEAMKNLWSEYEEKMVNLIVFDKIEPMVN